MINSRFLDGMTIEQAKDEVAKRLESFLRQHARRRAAGKFPLGYLAAALLGLSDPGDPLAQNAMSCRYRTRTCRWCCPRT